jgi:hypothetical protein
MLSEFAQIVEEIVRGAEALEKALTQGRERLSQIAHGLQTQPAVSPLLSDPRILPQGRERLSQIAHGLQTQPAVSPVLFDPRILPQGREQPLASSTVVNLDVLQEVNARALTRALQGTRPPATHEAISGGQEKRLLGQLEKLTPSAETIVRQLVEQRRRPEGRVEGLSRRTVHEAISGGQEKRLLGQLEKLTPSAETIARQLVEQRRRPEGRVEGLSRRTVRGRGAVRVTGPRRRASGLAGRLQDLLWTRRGRVWRWRLERSRSPLRQYVGRSLTQFAERGSTRQLFASLRRAPVAMRGPQAIQTAQAAGISQGTLARGAAFVGMIGQVGGALARLAAVLTGPVGAALALVTALASATVALVRWARGLEDSVFAIQRTAESFTRVHSGMAGLAAQLEAARLQEQRRVAEGTYLTTRLYAAMAERYRRGGEDLRILGTNLANLGRTAGLAAGEMIKVATGLKLLERSAGWLNRQLEWGLNKLGVEKGKGPQDWWFDRMQRFRDVQIDIPQRQKPPELFNKRPKK